MYIIVLFSCFLCWHLQIVRSQYEICKHTTCRECITDPVKCAWCSADGLNLDERCKLTSSISHDWCPGFNENSNSEMYVTEDHNFTSRVEDGIQIKPQKIKVKLRVGEAMKFKFIYKPAEDYPIDMYFLHDASFSMSEVKENFHRKSQEIYSAILKLTKNVYFGLGFFIDKNVMPTNDKPHSAICYSFKHKLSLTNELYKFNESLNEMKMGYNYDVPEGGLDGLAQAMACKKQIGWRKTSRKMIIYITDALVHTAGDGMLAGITDPYDGGCYLNDEGVYFKEKEIDYPSTGMISKLAADEQYTTLFVATAKKAPALAELLEHYKTLSGVIPGAHIVEYDKDKMSEKLSDIYKQISDNLQLDVNMEAKDKDHFEIKFEPDCTDKKNCAVVIGQEKHINVTIKLRKYYGKDHIEIPIVQRGLKENLTLVVDIISSCACEHKSKTKQRSRLCSYAGDEQCGICKCDADRTGPTCLCDENNNSNSTSKESCMKDHVECSNNGKCICGGCVCQQGFGGVYCEYRNNNCKRDHTGALCSDHGECRNGVCYCDVEWTGEMCECVISDSSCRDANHNICNNRGHCECGQCKCDILPTWDVRGYQDKLCNQHKLACDNCHDMQCRALTGCIACHSSNNTDCSAACDTGIIVVNASTASEDTKRKWNLCARYHHMMMSGCYSNFSYIYDDAPRGIVLFLLSEPDCIESYYIYGSMSLMILVVVSLASLLGWKLMTEADDRKEYELFLEKAREENEEVLNECYMAPTNTFRNPMFKRSFR